MVRYWQTRWLTLSGSRIHREELNIGIDAFGAPVLLREQDGGRIALQRPQLA